MECFALNRANAGSNYPAAVLKLGQFRSLYIVSDNSIFSHPQISFVFGSLLTTQSKLTVVKCLDVFVPMSCEFVFLIQFSHFKRDPPMFKTTHFITFFARYSNMSSTSLPLIS